MIYFLRAGNGGPIKIGYAADVEKRIAGLQTASHEPLELMGMVEGSPSYEKEIHQRLAAYRLRGEWFRPRDEVLAAIEMIKRGELPPVLRIEMPDNPITQTKARVRLAIEQGHTPGSLARLAGLHRNSLYGCDDPGWNPKAETLEKLWPHLAQLDENATA